MKVIFYLVPLKIGMNLNRYVADKITDAALDTLVVKIDCDDDLTGWRFVFCSPLLPA